MLQYRNTGMKNCGSSFRKKVIIYCFPKCYTNKESIWHWRCRPESVNLGPSLSKLNIKCAWRNSPAHLRSDEILATNVTTGYTLNPEEPLLHLPFRLSYQPSQSWNIEHAASQKTKVFFIAPRQFPTFENANICNHDVNVDVYGECFKVFLVLKDKIQEIGHDVNINNILAMIPLQFRV